MFQNKEKQLQRTAKWMNGGSLEEGLYSTQEMLEHEHKNKEGERDVPSGQRRLPECCRLWLPNCLEKFLSQICGWPGATRILCPNKNRARCGQLATRTAQLLQNPLSLPTALSSARPIPTHSMAGHLSGDRSWPLFGSFFPFGRRRRAAVSSLGRSRRRPSQWWFPPPKVGMFCQQYPKPSLLSWTSVPPSSVYFNIGHSDMWTFQDHLF